MEWSKYYVLMLSCLEAKWDILIRRPAPRPEYLKKVRILMDNLKTVEFGKTIRVYKAGDVAECFLAGLGFTGAQDVIGEPIFWSTIPDV